MHKFTDSQTIRWVVPKSIHRNDLLIAFSVAHTHTLHFLLKILLLFFFVFVLFILHTKWTHNVQLLACHFMEQRLSIALLQLAAATLHHYHYHHFHHFYHLPPNANISGSFIHNNNNNNNKCVSFAAREKHHRESNTMTKFRNIKRIEAHRNTIKEKNE